MYVVCVCVCVWVRTRVCTSHLFDALLDDVVAVLVPDALDGVPHQLRHQHRLQVGERGSCVCQP